MTGAVEIDYRELLDADGTVVGFVDPDGIAHEFPHVEGAPDRYPVEAAGDHGKTRTVGDPLILPESALFLLDDEADAVPVDADDPQGALADAPEPDADEENSGIFLGDDVDALARDDED